MESIATPRVSSQILDQFVGKNVMIVAKVLQLRGETAIIDADGQITANLHREAHLTPGNGIQIIGKVNPDLSIKVFSSMELGNDVDYQLAQNVVDVTHQYKELFSYGDSGGMN